MSSQSLITEPILDEIQIHVNEIWKTSPSIGFEALMLKLEAMNLSSEITRQRVKAAKQAIPYVYQSTAVNADGSLKHDVPKLTEKQMEFVSRKIEERTSLRSCKRYKESDEIRKGLSALGVIIDDRSRTWSIGENPNLEKEYEIQQQITTGHACRQCGKFFASKNLVFKHLRDVSTNCGNMIFQNGEKLPDAPSQIRKWEKKEAYKARRRNTGNAVIHDHPDATLWFGDIPLAYTRPAGQYKRLRAILREYLPRNVPQPWIKKVVRKSYRQGQISDRPDTSQHEKDPYLGFAILVFRDADEARMVVEETQGLFVVASNVFKDFDCPEMPTFQIKIKQRESENTESKTENVKSPAVKAVGNVDPPLREQLLPLSLPQLQERFDAMIHHNIKDENEALLSGDVMEEHGTFYQQHGLLLPKVIELYEKAGPRREVLWEGKPVPEPLCNALHSLLRTLRWPAESHRKSLTSERYLVLLTNIKNDRFYRDLRHECGKLMEHVDPEYYYSGIAVTKNFVCSPHVDDRDQSFQYAISLGDFENGGQLCVEGTKYAESGQKTNYINVVDTHNRIARTDGRCVHWVRTWEKGDRYSLIFYDTTDQNQTCLNEAGVDETFATLKS